MRQLTGPIALLIVLGLVLTACTDKENQTDKLLQEYAPRVGYLAPDFQLTDYKGNPVKLSDFKGKPVFINFWATWCLSCRQEMPDIAAANLKYQKDGLVVLGIDAREDDATIKRFVVPLEFNWTMLMDYKGEQVATYGVAAFPTNFFMNRQGFIRATQVGGMDSSGIEERLAKILK